MPASAPVVVRWGTREPPLIAAAVTTAPGQGHALVDAVVGRVSAGMRLRVMAGSGRLIVLAEPDDLPWCPGARYLGWEAGLLWPTEIAPSVPAELLKAAAGAAAGSSAGDGSGRVPLLVVLPDALIYARLPVHPVDVEALMAMFGGSRR